MNTNVSGVKLWIGLPLIVHRRTVTGLLPMYAAAWLRL